MNDSTDVNLMMEFRQRYETEWKAFLKEQGMYDEWNKWVESCK